MSFNVDHGAGTRKGAAAAGVGFVRGNPASHLPRLGAGRWRFVLTFGLRAVACPHSRSRAPVPALLPALSGGVGASRWRRGAGSGQSAQINEQTSSRGKRPSATVRSRAVALARSRAPVPASAEPIPRKPGRIEFNPIPK